MINNTQLAIEKGTNPIKITFKDINYEVKIPLSKKDIENDENGAKHLTSSEK